VQRADDAGQILQDAFARVFPQAFYPAAAGLWQYTGDPPHMDLDNLAKALLDALTGHVFEDDSQVARLLVERRVGEREGIWLRAEAL